MSLRLHLILVPFLIVGTCGIFPPPKKVVVLPAVKLNGAGGPPIFSVNLGPFSFQIGSSPWPTLTGAFNGTAAVAANVTSGAVNATALNVSTPGVNVFLPGGGGFAPGGGIAPGDGFPFFVPSPEGSPPQMSG